MTKGDILKKKFAVPSGESVMRSMTKGVNQSKKDLRTAHANSARISAPAPLTYPQLINGQAERG